MIPSGAAGPRSRRTRFCVGVVVALVLVSCSGDDAAGPVGPTNPATVSVLDPTTTSTTTPTTTSRPTSTTSVTSTTSTVPVSLPPVEWPDVTGAGVTLAVLDRGIDWRHPDVRNADGSTRIEAIIDLSAQQNGCAVDRPDPAVHVRADIDAALAGAVELDHRDAVGHGTASAGVAAGNGSASDGRFRGVAPGVDLVVVKLSSEGVAAGTDAVGDGAGEEPVAGCLDDALRILDLVMEGLDQPAVALWNTGTQFGPIDGTSATSRRIAESFGPDRPGRIWVAPAGDEGASPSRVRGTLLDGTLTVPFLRPAATRSNPTLWYSGEVSATVSVTFADGSTEGVRVGPVGPGESITADGVTIVHYEPATEFHPWTSTSGDRAVWISIDRPPGAGTIEIDVLGGADGAVADGRVDVFGDVLGTVAGATSIEFVDGAPGGVSDTASTPGAVVATAHAVRTSWIDRAGRLVDQSPAVALGGRWPGASVDPTRDGRAVIAVSAPAHHVFASLAAGSAFSRVDDIVPLEGDGSYVVFTGTSAAAAMVAGAVALALEVDPTLTGHEMGELLRSTAVSDEHTGEVPNPEWGHGKLDIAALVAAARP
jgi:minor extracellular serine protease Vpr